MPHDRAVLLHNEAFDHLEVLTNAACGACDRYAAGEGVPGVELMDAAGRAVATAIQARWAERPVVVLCGPGNNGGDGYVCARYLKEAGWPVDIVALTEIDALSGDAALAARAWDGPIGSASDGLPARAELVVDALFGAGLARPLEGAAAALIEEVGVREIPCVAVDLPSGWRGDGSDQEGVAGHANLTVTFHRCKLAHLLEPTATACGKTVLADIGIPVGWVDEVPMAARLNAPRLWVEAWPDRGPDTHKHEKGRLVVFSGGAGSTGAARLAAHGALRIGAGLVTLATPPSALLVNATHAEAVMLARWEGAETTLELLQDRRATASVLGPAIGVGERTREVLAQAARHDAPLVVDADALGSFAGEPDALAELVRTSDVLTPHAGEFERLFPGWLKSADNKLQAAQRAADVLGCTIVLKGPDTVIAAPNQTPVINRHASPALATAGSGDVLAGMIGGLIAGGMPGFAAACAACWLHGDVALRLGQGLTAEDIPAGLPTSLQALRRRLQRRIALNRLTSR
jgi:hydroxyethylthiazole kinase-like uncharacterized protein yjeF